MRIFNYDRETLIFIGEGTADPDPMVPGGWLIPACATLKEPTKPSLIPVGSAEFFSREKGGWVIKPIQAGKSDVAVAEKQLLTLPQRMMAMRQALVEHCNVVAASFGFDDMADAVSYAEEPAVPEFQRRGKALRAWRSLVWAAFEEIERAALAGEKSSPISASALFEQLPKFELPAEEEVQAEEESASGEAA